MFEKLENVAKRYEEIEQKLADPQVLARRQFYAELAKEQSDLVEIVTKYRQYKKALAEITEAEQILDDGDDELKELAEAELQELVPRREELEERLKFLLIPSDPQDSRNAIVEIRAGTGGDEASIFAGDLFRMYCKFCDMKGWKYSINTFTEGTFNDWASASLRVTGPRNFPS